MSFGYAIGLGLLAEGGSSVRDKAVQEVVAPAAGTLKAHAAVGQVYPVGALIAEVL
jgi:hypothetical protein